MTNEQVAKRLVELCRKGNWSQAQEELYAPDVESTEPAGTPWERVKGYETVREKAVQWSDMVEEIHDIQISEPLVAKDFFALRMFMDITIKGRGRTSIDEINIYEVKDGKIIKEQFFYSPE